MDENGPDVADLRERIQDLDANDRRALIAALAADRHDAGTSMGADRWQEYCEEYSNDPLCAGAGGRSGTPDAHLAGLSGGGGCAELWEHLSAYRDARRSTRR